MKWTIGRVFSLLIGLGLIGVSASFGWSAWNWRTKYKQCWAEELMPPLTVDLSQSGREYTAKLGQFCEMAHGQQVVLLAWKSDGTLADLVQMPCLEPPRVEIFSPTGEARVGSGGTFDGQRFAAQWPMLGPALLWRGYLGPDGTYALKIRTVDGDRSLAGLRQEIRVTNEMCGCESLPIGVGMVLAVASGVPGLVFAGWAMVLIVNRRKTPTLPAPTTTAMLQV